MKARPILFNSAMVRAILAGKKTVTRRAMRVQPALNGRLWEVYGAGWSESVLSVPAVPGHSLATQCPYGQVGDRLWVRETFMDLRGTGVEHRPDPNGPLQRYAYAAECPPGSHADEARKDFGLKWKPSIHMPRAACRIELEITAVRVERLQAISADQAEAEGVDAAMCRQYLETAPSRHTCREAVIHGFSGLWHATGGDWEANPWVWGVEFRRVLPEAVPAGVAA